MPRPAVPAHAVGGVPVSGWRGTLTGRLGQSHPRLSCQRDNHREAETIVRLNGPYHKQRERQIFSAMTSIRDRAKQALQLFNECCHELSQNTTFPSSQEHQVVVSDLRGRFGSWCGNLGALQHGHASLDWRLRDSESMEKEISSHLSGLTEDLEDCGWIASHNRSRLTLSGLRVFTREKQTLDELTVQSSISSDGNDSDSDDDPFDPQTQIDEHLSSLKHTIDNLYKLSFLIRNRKSKQSAALKAESYKKFTEQGTDLFELFEHHDRERAYNFVQQARVESSCLTNPGIDGEDESLFGILSQASSKRRRQFAYWEAHSKKLASDHTTTTPRITMQGTRAGTVAAMSGTEATPLPYATEMSAEEARSVATSVSTAWGLGGTKAVFPKAPNSIGGQTEFECPFCHIWCQDAERRHWR